MNKQQLLQYLQDIEWDIIDAVISHDVTSVGVIWVPLLDRFQTDYKYFQEWQAAGDEVWYYTCTVC